MSAEESEPPYPVVATQDLAANYSLEHFKYSIQQCRDVIARVIADDDSSEQQIARVRILRYLDLQLSRAVRWAEDETDLMAGVVRSLIEIEFWADFVSVSAEQAKRFLEETNIDAREMVEALHAYGPEMQELPIPPFPGRRVVVKPTNSERAVYWKLCSKLMHPSAWVLNHPEETLFNENQRQLLAVKTVYYGWVIVCTFHKIEWTP